MSKEHPSFEEMLTETTNTTAEKHKKQAAASQKQKHTETATEEVQQTKTTKKAEKQPVINTPVNKPSNTNINTKNKETLIETLKKGYNTSATFEDKRRIAKELLDLGYDINKESTDTQQKLINTYNTRFK